MRLRSAATALLLLPVVLLVGSLVVSLVVVLAAAFLLELDIDASRWRTQAEQAASHALGRPVKLQGELTLQLGRQLDLRLASIRIQNSAGFSQAELLVLSQARVRVDVLDALRGRPRLSSFEADEARIQLERGRDGRDNWSPPKPRYTASRLALELDRLTVRRLDLHYQDLAADRHFGLGLSELSASARAGEPLQLALRLHAGPQTAYALRFSAAPLPRGGATAAAPAQAWPFKLALESAATSLHAEGHVDLANLIQGGRQDRKLSLNFDARTDDLATLLGQPSPALPPTLPAKLSGKLLVSAAALDLQALRAQLGESDLAGDLGFTWPQGRPRIQGRLIAGKLDLRPWLEPATGPWAGSSSPPDAAPVRLRELLAGGPDLNIDLQVGRWLGAAVDIDQTELALTSDGQTARMALKATVAGTPLTGQIAIDTRPARATLDAALSARPALQDLPGLSGFSGWSGFPGVSGRLGQLDLRLSGQGETLDSIWPGLAFTLTAGAGQLDLAAGALPGRLPNKRPLVFSLHKLALQAGPGQPLQGQALGRLQGEQARLTLSAGTLAELWQERATPVDMTLRLMGSNLSARLAGRLSMPAGAASKPRLSGLSFALQAPRVGDLAPFIPIDPAAELPLYLNGLAHLDGGSMRLSSTRLRLGRSDLELDAQAGRLSQGPPARLSLRSRLLDLRELSTLQQPGPTSADSADSAESAATAALSPTSQAWPWLKLDLNLDMRLQRVLLPRAAPTDIEDISLTGHLRGGRLLASALAGRVAGQKLTGRLEVDPRGAQTAVQLELGGSGPVNLGALLRGLGAAEAAETIDGRADALALRVSGRGGHLRDWADQATLHLRLQGGRLSLLGSGRRPLTEIDIDKAHIDAGAGQPLTAELTGSVGQTPVRLALRTAKLADFVRSKPQEAELPFQLEAHAADTQLRLEGRAALPLGRAATLNFEASGERLDSLTPLLRVKLPTWGPWRLRGPLQMTADGYVFEQLRLRVGESQLGGRGQLDLSGARPRLDVRVSGRSVQLADFPTPELGAEPPDHEPAPSAAADPAGTTDLNLRGQVGRTAKRIEGLLSAGFLRRFDADIDVVAREVLSGSDRLADGELHLKLNNGHLLLDPAFVNLPGGSMRLTASFDPSGEQMAFEAQVDVERFDYGIIARRMGSAAHVKGLFSAQLALAGRASSLERVLRQADGKIAITVWPTDLPADVFNLWSVNLFLNLVPLLDPGGQPQVNCVVARLALKNGVLSEEALTIDTTRVRVHGSGWANLATEELAFVFRPRAKGFALFRLQTPLRVSGTLDSQRVGIHRSDLIESTLRSALSPIWLPIERLRLGPNPPDGADLCGDPMRGGRR